MRKFLTQKRCFDELISLEIEWGNFEEAAKASRLKVLDTQSELLIHVGELHRESSLLILWHVFMNSLVLQSAEEPFP